MTAADTDAIREANNRTWRLSPAGRRQVIAQLCIHEPDAVIRVMDRLAQRRQAERIPTEGT